MSSTTNGRGVYVRAGTENNDYPIYYYRGNVTNNNVKFANYCWRIVRSTDTGGVKMIFNGEPSSDGKCANFTYSDNTLPQVHFNYPYNSLAYAGYMYGDVYEANVGTSDLYATNATYNDGIYTLSNDRTNTLTAGYRYSCGNSDTSCTTIRYYFFANETGSYYFNLTGGKFIEEAVNDMLSNKTPSTIKKYIEEEWFANEMVDFEEKLEDTIYCNSRELVSNSFKPNTNLSISPDFKNKRISLDLTCSRLEDRFTTSTTNGNGELKYPVGLITEVEATLAGGVFSKDNSDYYLYNGERFYFMTPHNYYNGQISFRMISGHGSIGNANGALYVRPVVSLKKGITFTSGNGTSDSPYVVN